MRISMALWLVALTGTVFFSACGENDQEKKPPISEERPIGRVDEPPSTPQPAEERLTPEEEYLRFAQAGNLDRVREMLEAGIARLDARDAAGRTALMLAASGGHVALVKYLLQKDEQDLSIELRNLTDNEGRSATDYAKDYAASNTEKGEVLLLFFQFDTVDPAKLEPLLFEYLSSINPERDLAKLEWLVLEMGVSPNAARRAGNVDKAVFVPAVFYTLGVRIDAQGKPRLQAKPVLAFAKVLDRSPIALDLTVSVDLGRGPWTPAQLFERLVKQGQIPAEQDSDWRQVLQLPPKA